MKTTRFFLRKSPKEPIDRILNPFHHFLHTEAAGGILLLISAAVALIWANSPWHEGYHHLWHEEQFSFKLLGLGLKASLHHWINDGLMAIFFFFVGLEIKREILVGELAHARKAALPIAAAIGGVVIPALIYFAFNPSGPEANGWGVPMATDIAFSLGILALLGSRIPIEAKIFLTALAIVDDICASLVIAIFYTDEISVSALIWGFGFLGLMLGMNRLGIRRALPFSIVGFFVWFAFAESGVHPTLSGILAAMMIPVRTRINPKEFIFDCKIFLREFQKSGVADENALASSRQAGALRAIESAAELSQTPLHRLEHMLHGWVNFLIMPVFALANAGVHFDTESGSQVLNSVSIGVVFGLIVGKQVGVTLFAWVAVKLGIASLPASLNWKQIYGIAWIAGIGFTMSLFIAGLAFKGDANLNSAKLGILVASGIAGVVGFLILRASSPLTPPSDTIESVTTKNPSE